MKKIPLSKGKFAVIDDEDFDKIGSVKWHLSSNGYAVSTTHEYIDGFRKTYHPSMHSLINRTPRGKSTDHINGDKLDNRRSNLRTCTQSQNMANRGHQVNNKSGYKGVYWAAGKWTAQIRLKGETIYLGRSSDIKEAARMYNKAAQKYHGEYARL